MDPWSEERSGRCPNLSRERPISKLHLELACRDKYNMLKVKNKTKNTYEEGASGTAVDESEEEQEMRNLVEELE